VYTSDSQGNTSTTGTPCIIEINSKIATGTSRTAYSYTILSAEIESPHPTDSLQNLMCGVIKYYNQADYATKEQLLDTDCLKLRYLSGLANEFNNSCGLRLISFVNCAKIELDNGEICMLEPLLDEFELACNNDGDGWEDLDDRLSSFAHYVFEKSQHKYLPCDFQGDLSRMMLTDPEINSCTPNEDFNGIPTRGKEGAWKCLRNHLSRCDENKFCNCLKLSSHVSQ